MQNGQSSLATFRSLIEADQRSAWIRAVALRSPEGPSQLLVARVIVGPKPEHWEERVWRYESCVFVEGELTLESLMTILDADSNSVCEIGGERLELEVSVSNVNWTHRPSLAAYDEPKIPYPSHVYALRISGAEMLNAPTDYLVGEGTVRSYPVFSIAFDMFFRGELPATGSQNPLMGELTVRVVDERARIVRVSRVSDQLEVEVDGSAIRGKILEFGGSTYSNMKTLGASGVVSFDLPQGEIPRDAWIWLKDGCDWLDFRSLQSWGGYVSPDVRLTDQVQVDKPLQQAGALVPGASWLRERAISSARRGLSSYVAEEIRDFFVFAGHAIELACKALLAGQNLAFLAPNGNFRSASTLWAFRDDMERLPNGTPTIGAKEAFDRIAILHSEMDELKPGVLEILQQRNGEVHLGVVDATMQNRVIVSFLRTIHQLLGIDNTAQDEFWSPHDDLVRTILNENAIQIERTVHLKISAAIEKFKVIQSLPPEQRDAFVAVIVSQQADLEVDQTTVACPACRSVSIASGTNEIEVGEVTVGSGGVIEGVNTWLVFTPLSLRCAFCGLHLENRAELATAGVSGSWVNDDESLKQVLLEEGPAVSDYLDGSDYQIDF